MRRDTLSASDRLLVEWTSEVRDMYKNLLRMSREQFFELLTKVKPYIEKQVTSMRECMHICSCVVVDYLEIPRCW